MSMEGWQGMSDAVAMRRCTTCSSVSACAWLRVGSLHSPAPKLFAKTLSLHWILWTPSQPFNCFVHVVMDTLSWEAGETQEGHLQGPRQSLGLLLPPFTGRETAGIKKNNEQRNVGWSPRVFFLTPDQICARLRFAFAFLGADGGG